MSPTENQIYIKLQVGLMALMMSLKVILSEEDYVKRVAPLFEMMVKGHLTLASDEDVARLREKVRAVVVANGTER